MNIKIHIISGFLGAGKTTFIRKIIPFMQGRVALIENEYSNLSVDSELFMNENIIIKEIFSGCICCSLMKDFRNTIDELTNNYELEHIFIEPSGVGCLSDILDACIDISKLSNKIIEVQSVITFVDASSFEDYIDSFGEFFVDQIQNAEAIIITHVEDVNTSTLNKIIDSLKSINDTADIFSDDYLSCTIEKNLDILEAKHNLEANRMNLGQKSPADVYFSSISIANLNKLSMEDLVNLPKVFKNKKAGTVLRAKGIIQLVDSRFVHFDFTSNYFDWEFLSNSNETKLSVIGKNLGKTYITGLFSDVLEEFV